MNNHKNQNSILVLATLGVYLGLVLVGAAPQVLAQAAMTRQFDVKDEIEVKDDLDKKPNDEACSDLGTVANKQLDEFGFDKYIAISLVNVIKGSVTDFVVPGNKLSSQFGDNGFLHTFVPKSTDSSFRNSLDFQIEPQKSNSTFRFTYTLQSTSDAFLFSNALYYSFRYIGCNSHARFEKLAYDGSLISYKNNQVLIVTRLPRAGLDSLLATDAK